VRRYATTSAVSADEKVFANDGIGDVLLMVNSCRSAFSSEMQPLAVVDDLHAVGVLVEPAAGHHRSILSSPHEPAC
jgi:hypothetical protein